MPTTLARTMTSWGFWGTIATTALLLVALACSSGNNPTEPEDPFNADLGNDTLEDGGPETSPDDSVIDIEKFTNGQDVLAEPGPYIPMGETVTWDYVVTNTGAVNLANIEVTDDQEDLQCLVPDVLSPGESFTCSAEGVATAGQYANIATVTAEDPRAPPNRYSDTDVSYYFGVEAAIDIEKSTNGQDADSPPGPSIPIGDPVVWEYKVTNTGDVNLANIEVTDDQEDLQCLIPNVLSPGESFTCSAEGVATAGQYENVATVTADDPRAPPNQYSDSDPSHYFGIEFQEGAACGLGYWKNHLAAWAPTPYAPDQMVGSVFLEADLYGLDQNSLLEALRFGGGPGAEGGAMILLRHAVAALLNATHPGIDYPRTESEVVNDVDAALASGNRNAMLALKDDLEFDNEAGCSLD